MPRTTPKTTVDEQPIGGQPETDAPTVDEQPPAENPAPEATTAPDNTPEPSQDAAPTAPEPDEYGRYRVRDEDTGHELTIHAAALPHGKFTVLDELATDPFTGEPVPAIHKPTVETTTSGQQAENKENLDA